MTYTCRNTKHNKFLKNNDFIFFMYINVDDETKINLMSKKKQKINPKHNSITLYRFLLIYRIQFIHDIQLNKL